MLVQLHIYFLCGRSDPRNDILHQMFSHLGFGERAGSGLFMISSVWKNKNWIKPELEDELNPNRTILTLKMKKDNNYKCQDKCRDNVGINSTQRKILNFIRQNQSITQEEMATELNTTVRTIQRNINSLKKKNILERVRC